jgi:Cd2+/Zn2+-exporting ATPase
MANAVLERDPVREDSDACPICGCSKDECPRETCVFYVDNLDCASCAAKMEDRIAHLDAVDDVSLTFATKKLRVTCAHPEERLAQFQEACASVDAGVVVSKLGERGTARTSHEDRPAEGDGRSRGHDHDQGNTHARELEPRQVEHDRTRAEDNDNRRRDLACIAISAVLFVLGLVCEHVLSSLLPISAIVADVIYVAAYLVAGGEVLAHAARNLRHGKVFDENFLMSVATFGAFAVQQFPEAVGVMLFYRIGEYFEDRAVERSRGQIMAAVDLRPETLSRLVGYAPAELPVAALQDADHVVPVAEHPTEVIAAEDARVGDYVLVRPGDRIPLDATVMEGSSTLDTSPVTGESVPVAVKPGEEALSGCVNLSGMLVLRVDKPLDESMVTRILDAVENAAASKPHIERFISRFARVYTPVVIAIAALTAIVPSLVTGEWMQWVYTACTFLVISCPCALVLSVPLAYFSGIGAASKLGILFRGGSSLEALKNVKAVVMDKTGTITKGTFSLQAIHPAVGFSDEQVLQAAASVEQGSTHPVARSIVKAARERLLHLDGVQSLHEVAGHGVSALLPASSGGAVLCGNRALLEDAGIALPADADDAQVFVAIGGVYAGSLEISDVEKPESAEAIATIKRRGIHPVMLTGDAPENAERIAGRVGIEDVRARLLPEGKLEALRQVRARYGSAMFVGDGINDAPVLAGADVGAAMGSGADAAIEAADVVFMTSSLDAIPKSLDIARVVGRIAMENIVFALVVKSVVLVLGFMGLASMWAAVFADVGVVMICVLNSVRILSHRF